jgi:hypothetical protein
MVDIEYCFISLDHVEELVDVDVELSIVDPHYRFKIKIRKQILPVILTVDYNT